MTGALLPPPTDVVTLVCVPRLVFDCEERKFLSYQAIKTIKGITRHFSLINFCPMPRVETPKSHHHRSPIKTGQIN